MNRWMQGPELRYRSITIILSPTRLIPAKRMNGNCCTVPTVLPPPNLLLTNESSGLRFPGPSNASRKSTGSLVLPLHLTSVRQKYIFPIRNAIPSTNFFFFCQVLRHVQDKVNNPSHAIDDRPFSGGGGWWREVWAYSFPTATADLPTFIHSSIQYWQNTRVYRMMYIQ